MHLSVTGLVPFCCNPTSRPWLDIGRANAIQNARSFNPEDTPTLLLHNGGG